MPPHRSAQKGVASAGMTRQARATIDCRALVHNLECVRRAAPASRIMAVVKADAYGHGMRAVVDSLSGADAFAVANVAEALTIRAWEPHRRLVVLQGPRSADQLRRCVVASIEFVIHTHEQLEMLEAYDGAGCAVVWIKLDTGMRRLGFAPAALHSVYRRLTQLPRVAPDPGLMTHLACADEPMREETSRQLSVFDEAVAGRRGEVSIANSAGILAFPGSHRDWVRPGLMLYGCSPFERSDGVRKGLRPVMALTAPILSVRQCRAGDAVGYGAAYICPEAMPVGVVGIGYADGYPRHVRSGAPALVNGERVSLVGRVSMDMIAVDLRRAPTAAVDDEVVLWGPGLPVEDIAANARTISYELLCRAGNAVERCYV